MDKGMSETIVEKREDVGARGDAGSWGEEIGNAWAELRLQGELERQAKPK